MIKQRYQKKREFIIQDNKNPEYPEVVKVELIQDKVSLLDDCYCIDNIIDWEVKLILDPKFRSQKQFPDWFGYMKIDKF